MTTRLLIEKMSGLADSWQKNGLPSHETLAKIAMEINTWKKENAISGLWVKPPLMITATLDDGMGMGLNMIHLYAKALGIRIMHLGLLKTPEMIIGQVKIHRPGFLGLTVLQFDTEDDLVLITGNLPRETILIAGGPVFKADPGLAERAGVHVVAENVAVFITYMLKNKL